MRKVALLAGLLISCGAIAGVERTDNGTAGSTLPAPANNGRAVSVALDVGATSLTQTGRLTRDGVPSTCAAPKAYPGGFNPGSTYRRATSGPLYNNTASTVCAQVTATASAGCDINVFFTAYLGSFVPGNLATNYLADTGSSFGIPPSGPLTFEVLVPANSSIVVNANDSNSPNDGTTCIPTITSNQLDSTAFVESTAVPAPSLGVFGLTTLALLLGGLGVVAVRRYS